MNTQNNTTEKKTILYFHTGRGGRYYNDGFTSFRGEKTISEVLSIVDDGKHPSFRAKKNQHEIARLLNDRNLDNLAEFFENCNDKDDFAEFENKTGLKLGEDIYVDCNGNEIITAAELEEGTGTLDWDGAYDTDNCILLSDCSEQELRLIIESDDDYNKKKLVQEYFNENTDLNIDWSKFNEDYLNLISDYYNGNIFDISDFYKSKEVEEDI